MERTGNKLIDDCNEQLIELEDRRKKMGILIKYSQTLENFLTAEAYRNNWTSEDMLFVTRKLNETMNKYDESLKIKGK